MQDAMRKEKPAQNEQATDEELFEVLIAISEPLGSRSRAEDDFDTDDDDDFLS